MPLKLQLLSDSGVKWVGWCKQRLFALTGLRRQLHIPAVKRTYALPDNIMVQVISSDICDIIRIWGGIGGFISHPRNNLHPFGLDLEGKDLGLLSDFPLVDDDHGSAIIDLNGKAEWTEAENYGNMAFVADDEVLSWRGPSGGYILDDPAQRVVGFTEQFEDYALYTPLSPNLYQSGEAEVMPGNVRCAAVIAGVSWVVIEVGGVDELRMQQGDEWVVIASRPAETYLGTAIPCIFQQDKVILQKGEWALNGDWTGYAEPQGTLTRGAGWNITKTADGIILYPGVTASLRSTDITVVDDYWSKTPGSVTAYAVDNGPVVITGPDAPVDGNQYTATGGTGPYTWGISVGTITEGTVGGINSLCDTATITVDDQCGQSASKIVRMPGGTWQSSAECFPDQNPETAVGAVNGWFYVDVTHRWRISGGPTVVGGYASNSCLREVWRMVGGVCRFDVIYGLGGWVAVSGGDDSCSNQGAAAAFPNCDGSNLTHFGDYVYLSGYSSLGGGEPCGLKFDGSGNARWEVQTGVFNYWYKFPLFPGAQSCSARVYTAECQVWGC